MPPLNSSYAEILELPLTTALIEQLKDYGLEEEMELTGMAQIYNINKQKISKEAAMTLLKQTFYMMKGSANQDAGEWGAVIYTPRMLNMVGSALCILSVIPRYA